MLEEIPAGTGNAHLPCLSRRRGSIHPDRLFAPAAEANAGQAPLPVQGQVTVLPTGGGQPLNIRNPALGLNYIIALVGVYPSRP